MRIHDIIEDVILKASEGQILNYMKLFIDQPCRFNSGGHFLSKEQWRHPSRVGKDIELILCTQGYIHMKHDEVEANIGVNETRLLLDGKRHEGTDFSQGHVSFFWLHFMGSYELIDEEQAKQFFVYEGISKETKQPFIIIPLHMHWEDVNRLKVLISQLIHVHTESDYNPYAKDYMMTSILLELSHLTKLRILASKEDETSRRLNKIKQWITSHSDAPINYHDVAHAFQYNSQYLNRFFKEHTGITINSFIHMQRVENAKALLRHSNMTVKEIAHEIGYIDEKYFYKRFKSLVGMTPLQFQNLYVGQYINTK